MPQTYHANATTKVHIRSGIHDSDVRMCIKRFMYPMRNEKGSAY